MKVDLHHTIKEEVQKYLQERQRENLRRKEVLGLGLLQVKDKPCEKCGSKDQITIDHIIPQQMIKWFAIDPELEYWPENIRPLCKKCNMFKGNQLDFTSPLTKPNLLKLLERV